MKTLTFSQLHKSVSRVRPFHPVYLRRIMKKAGVQALGARQRPQRYPVEAPHIVLEYLGLNGRSPVARTLPPMAELRSLRRRASR